MGFSQLLSNVRQLISPTILQTEYSDLAVVVDVSSWQQVVDFQALKDMGVDAVAIRAFHPTHYTAGSAQYVIDKYYFERIHEARRVGLFTMAYGVPAYVMDIQDPHGIPNTTAIMDKAWGDEQNRAHVLVIDAEINYYYQGTSRIVASQANTSHLFMQSLRVVQPRYNRPTMLYTRVTWMEEATGHYMRTALDDANSGATELFPLWLAFYPSVFNVNWPFTHVDEILAKVPPITTTNRKYLEFGVSSWYMWQLGAKFLSPAVTETSGRQTGFDVNIVRHGAREMWNFWGYVFPEDPPIPPVIPAPPRAGDFVTRQEFNGLAEEVGTLTDEVVRLVTFMESVKDS